MKLIVTARHRILVSHKQSRGSTLETGSLEVLVRAQQHPSVKSFTVYRGFRFLQKTPPQWRSLRIMAYITRVDNWQSQTINHRVLVLISSKVTQSDITIVKKNITMFMANFHNLILKSVFLLHNLFKKCKVVLKYTPLASKTFKFFIFIGKNRISRKLKISNNLYKLYIVRE